MIQCQGIIQITGSKIKGYAIQKVYEIVDKDLDFQICSGIRFQCLL